MVKLCHAQLNRQHNSYFFLACEHMQHDVVLSKLLHGLMYDTLHLHATDRQNCTLVNISCVGHKILCKKLRE